MKFRETEDKLFPVVEPLVSRMGYCVVEIKSRHVENRLQIHLVIHKPGGISIDDCTEVYRAVMPRIEVVENTRDVHLEVSSPGVGRVLKSADEFKVFFGCGIKILINGSDGWIKGTIQGVLNDKMILATENGDREMAFDTIIKAKLD
ncbi:MAG: hypothetical protein AB1798_24235 [Spirochaetota bacterium]